MVSIAFVVHGGREDAKALSADAVAWVREMGHEAVLVTRGHDIDGADLVVSLGGDGTMLRAAGLIHGSGTPLLGVNLGHLGYLTAVEAVGLREALEGFLEGRYSLQERMTLEVVLAGTQVVALNEAVVEKLVSGHTVRLALSIGGRPFITYTADGLIVATPTGSTAYNLSSRGPIASPSLRAMIVTPVSPHMLFDRSLVLGPDEEVRIELVNTRPAALVVDGTQVGEMAPGDSVVCRASSRPVCLVGAGEHDFHDILRAKFGLPNHTSP